MSDTLRHVFKTLYLPERLSTSASPSTVSHYYANIKALDRFLERPATLGDLTDKTLDAAAKDMIDKRKFTAGTARQFQNSIRALWRFCARRHLVDVWPEMPMVKVPDRMPIAWQRDQLRRLFEACANQPGRIGGVPASLWWHGLHSALWDSGERIGAVLAIERSAVDLESGWLVIPAEVRKGRTKDNAIRLHADTCKILKAMREWLPDEEPRLFPIRGGMVTLYRDYSRLLRGAGLPHDRRHKFHCMRKSTASYFEAAGKDATKLLGHSARSVTLRYLDPRIVEKTHACDVLFRPDKPEKKPDGDAA